MVYINKLKRLTEILGIIVAIVAFSSEVIAQNVIFLTSDSLISTRRVLNGARKSIKRDRAETEFNKFLLSSQKLYYERQIDSIKALDPDIIITIGSHATEIGKTYFPGKPIVFASVMYPVLSGFVKSLARPGANITGASLNIPADIQFKNFLKIAPNTKKLGVLYSSNTASLIPSAKVLARQLGIDLISIKVDDSKGLPKALDSLTNECDGLWSVADPVLFTPQSTRFILLQTIRRSIPFMGFSRNVVESGALFALDVDYKAVGRQAGKIAIKILGGRYPGKIPVTSPDFIWFHYNEKTAGHIKITIPEEMIAVAKEVYR